MRTRRTMMVLASIVAIVSGCGRGNSRPELATRQLIADDAHGAANGLYFLPPVVPQPVLNGTFRSDISPVVQIDDLAGPNGPVLGALAVYTMTTGPGADTVRVGDSHYIVNWNTLLFQLDVQHVYRVYVLVDGRVLGSADVQPVSTGGLMRNVDTNEFVPLVDGRTLPIKFWLNYCAPVVCPVDQCKLPGICNGSNGQCDYQNKPDGTVCDDGDACLQTDTCQGGACAGANPVVCSAKDQCHVAGECDPATGACSDPSKPEATPCDDGKACTQTDACQAGECRGENPIVCTALDQCHDPGICDDTTGLCSTPPTGDGRFCDDGDLCTQLDVCQTGVCTGKDPIVCMASDQCHVAGVCAPATGLCSDPVRPDGSACLDGDACTQTDSCVAGVCTGTNPVFCTALDQCHVAGECSPATGKCTDPSKPDGTTCSDGNLCTRADTCVAGTCTGADPVVCATLDQCHVAGECIPGTGKCTDPTKPDGTSCDDDNLCTRTDTCLAGTCAGANPVTCAALDQCHVPGECAPSTGRCSDPAKPDGTQCSDSNLCTQTDTCVAGTCTGTNPVACSALDQCHIAGECAPATGECTHPTKPDGSECTDDDQCTQTDTCVAGTCTGTNPVICTVLDQCHVIGGCSPVSGECSNPVKPDGTACSDGIPSSEGDVCTMGQCQGIEPCAAFDQAGAGAMHTCAVRADGSLWCWGANDHGQLGDGTSVAAPTPVRSGTSTWRWSEVTAGGHHTCGLRRDGTLWCWGDNEAGQLGNGSSFPSAVSTKVEGDNWTTAQAGRSHTCGVRSDTSLWCWGDNGEGALGDGTLVKSAVPVQVTGNNWESVATGAHHTCAIKWDHTLWCWGANSDGRLGNGSTDGSAVPVQVGGDNWSAVYAGGLHTCGLQLDDSLWCWGSNGSGQLGIGTTEDSSMPVRIGTGRWTSAAAGQDHTCAVQAGGTLWCFGSNDWGQLGNGTSQESHEPVRIPGQAWTRPSAGTGHTCGLRQGGSIWCWGTNQSGELGDGSQTAFPSPKQVANTICGVVPICGNGTVESGEECDDGNNGNGDGCSADCVSENHAPTVSASGSPTRAMPGQPILLGAVATDDGLPAGSVLSYQWTLLSGPANVAIAAPTGAQTTASFAAAGDYVLQVEVSDSVLSVTAVVCVSVYLPDLMVLGTSVQEGHSGISQAILTVSLSAPAYHSVSLAYQTQSGTAAAGCDYLPSHGTLTLLPGEITKSFSVSVRGDLAVEADEAFSVVLGEPLGCNLTASRTTVSIQDDDEPNRAPSQPADLAPPGGAQGVALSPSLTWSSTDPDGDPVSFDVYLGTSFAAGGQTWDEFCPGGTAAPEARARAAVAYDDVNDRLILVGGEGTVGDLADVWVLVNATAAGATPEWQLLSPTGGPGPRKRASAAYDHTSNTLVFHGGCAGDCSSAMADTWILTGANGKGEAPSWKRLADAPHGRRDHATAYDEANRRLIVFGGCLDSNTSPTAELAVLGNATDESLAAWRSLSATGTPGARAGASVAYDAASNRMLVFGGRGPNDVVLSDVWVAENANGAQGPAKWSVVSASSAGPAARWGQGAGYDPVARRLVVYGGTNGPDTAADSFVFGDAWLFDWPVGGATGTWTKINAAENVPVARTGAAVVYSANQNRLVVSGGFNSHEPEPWRSDSVALLDAIGVLPQVAQKAPERSFATGPLVQDSAYFWRVVASDSNGAQAGTAAIGFTPQVNSAPRVNAGPDQVIGALTAQLQGMASDDGLPVGQTVTIRWTLVQGPSLVQLAAEDSLATSVTFPGSGTYVLRLTANDGKQISQDDVTITVQVTNSPPSVDAGPDQWPGPGIPVVLSAMVRDDGLPAGGLLEVTWTQTDGPQPAVIERPSLPSTSVSLPAPGVYVFRVTASDSLAQGFDEVTVTVATANHPPVITSTPITSFTINGDPSAPAVLDISRWTQVNYLSSFNQGPASWTVDSTHTVAIQNQNANPSIFLSDITLTQDRIEGDFRVVDSMDDDLIGFVFGFQDPTHFYLFDWKRADQWWPCCSGGFAQAGMSVKIVSAPSGVNDFDLWPSAGNGARVKVLYHNTIPWQRNVVYHYILDVRPGQFGITVTQGATTLAVISISDPTYLSGRFGFYNFSEGPVEYRAFKRSQLYSDNYTYQVIATDSDHDALTYSLREGPSPMEISPTTGLAQWHLTGADAGPHPVTVRATDSGGLFAEQSYVLTIHNLPSQRPEVNAGQDQTIELPTRTVSLVGTVTDDGKPIDSLQTEWNVTSGPGVVIFDNPTSLTTNAWFGHSGTYVLQLNASDSEYVSSDDVTVVVGVSSGPNLSPVVEAGNAEYLQIASNLAVNGGNELTSSGEAPVAWTVESGTWTGEMGSIPAFESQRGFRPAGSGPAILSQEIDVSRWAPLIDQGTQVFRLTANRYVAPGVSGMSGQVSIEYLWGQGGGFPIASYVSPSGGTSGDWVKCVIAQPAPVGTRWIRIRLLGWLGSGTDGEVAFDAIALRTGDAVLALNGVAYDDELPEPGRIATQWNVAGSNDGVTVFDPNALKTSVRFLIPGSHLVELSAFDGALTSLDAKTVDVRAQNQAPIVTTPSRIDFDLTAGGATVTASIVDSDGPSPVSLSWMQIAGPAPLTIDPPNAVATRIIASQQGKYSLRVVASDGDATAMKVVDVFVTDGQNVAPIVSAGPDLDIEWPRNQVTLSGTASDDGRPLGEPLQISWGKVLGPTGVVFSQQNVTSTQATFTSPGVYVLRLSASDSDLVGQDDVVVTVRAPGTTNMAPVVSAGPDGAVQFPYCRWDLHGNIADDGMPAASAVEVQWSMISGPVDVEFGSPGAAATSVSLFQTGSYTLRLNATDGAAFGFDDVVVVCHGANQPPQVRILGPSTVRLPPGVATLIGDVTDDGLPLGSVPQMAWTTVSGPGQVTFGTPSAAGTTTTFTTIGTYVLQLEVTDGALTSVASIDVEVQEGNDPPVLSAGADQTITLPIRTVALAGTVSDDGRPQGGSLVSRWSLVSGPGPAEFANWQAATTTATFFAAGIHVLRLTAQDGESSSYDDVVVTVVPEAPTGDGPRVALITPADVTTVTSPVEVTGSVAGATLVVWRLEYNEPSLGDEWQLVATGTNPVTGGVLGRFDPTMLLNGIYQVRLTAVDSSGRSASDQRSLVVRGNQKLGNFTVTFSDIRVPVSGIPIEVLRTYDSRNIHKADFGIGWTLSVSGMRVSETGRLGKGWAVVQQPGFFPTYCVQPTRAKRVSIILSDGRMFEFEPTVEDGCATFYRPDYVSIAFQALPGTYAKLAITNGGGAFVQGSELYDDIDFQVMDPTRYTLTLPDGQEFVIGDRTDSKPGLQSIRDRNGNTLTFGPGGITHSSGKVIAFARDATGRIIAVKDAMGNSLTYAYDPDGNLASVVDREGKQTRFVYDAERPHYLRDIIDPRGVRAIRNEYGDDGRLARSIDADGKAIVYTHDLAKNQEVITDRTGAARVLTYDPAGNVVAELDAEGGFTTRTFSPDDERLTETVRQTDSLSHTSKWKYENGNMTEQTNALEKTTFYTYNAWNQVVTTEDPLGHGTTNNYDLRNGNLLWTKDGFKHATTFTYYPDGNMATRTDRLGRPTTYTYDSFGNLASETDAHGKVTSYTYDDNGNRKTETRKRTKADGTQETLVTSYTYDKNGRLLSTKQPDGSETSSTYNDAGLRDTSTDAMGRVTHYTYDDQGRLLNTLYPDGTSTSATYDEEGRRKTSTDRGGRTTTMEYDRVGRLKKTIYVDTTFTTTEYYLNGWVKSSTDAGNHTTRYEYDPAGRQLVVWDAKNKPTRFTYDDAGNQQTVTDALNHTTTSFYDANNRLWKTQFHDLTFRTTTYDDEGQRIAETDHAEKTTKFGYDRLGRLETVTDALDQVTRYGYDEVGNRTSVTDAAKKVTRFEYDKVGRETKRILPDTSFEVKTYNRDGSLWTRTDFEHRTTTYGYDRGGRLTSKKYVDDSTVGFTYTRSGRRETATDGRGTTHYTYDERDRLTAIEYPDGKRVEYGYDPEGRRTSLTAKVGTTVLPTTYGYDVLDRIESVTDPGQRVFGLEYNDVGNLAKLVRPNGVDTAYTHDPLNRLKNIRTHTRATDTTIASYGYTLGATGIRTRIDEADGTARAYEYDELYRLTKETVTGAQSYENSFTYDEVSNRKTQTRTGAVVDAGAVDAADGVDANASGSGLVSYTYDNRDRLTGENGTVYTWSTNGNLVGKSGEATYEWDFEDRLVKVTKADGTVVENVYDVDGVMVRNSVTPAGGATQTTDLLVDTSGGLSHVVAEIDGSGGVAALYVRAGDMLLEEIRGGVAKMYEADGLGSTRSLLDATGAQTDTWSYEAFGSTLSSTGTGVNPYRFAGERFVEAAAMYQNRVRWLDTQTGLFVSLDPLVKVSRQPYQYADSSPATHVDPSGKITLVQVAVAAGIGATLGALSTVGYHHATGQAVTFKAVMIGAGVGAGAGVAAVLSPYAAAFLVGLGIPFTVRTLEELLPVVANPQLPWEQRVAAAGMVIAAVAGEAAGLSYVRQVRGNPRILDEDFRDPATVDQLLTMMNKRPDVSAKYATGDDLVYLETIVKAEGSHMMTESGSSILLRFDVATRRTALHEWLHRSLQRRAGTYRVNEDEFIESFLSRHAKLFRLDE